MENKTINNDDNDDDNSKEIHFILFNGREIYIFIFIFLFILTKIYIHNTFLFIINYIIYF